MSRGQEEFKFSCWVADRLSQFARPDALWTHFPAGETRTAMAGARLKRMGLQRGWADYEIILPGPRVYWLELKAKGGRLSDEQTAFAEHATANGCCYDVVHSGEQALDTLADWGVLRTMRWSA